jgi:hypothetical protein
MPTSSTNTRGLLRGILRLCRTPVLPPGLAHSAPASNPNSSRNAARAFVLEQYRLKQTRKANQLQENYQVDVEEESRLLRMAKTFHNLQQDLAERGRLYSLDASAETVLSPKEVSRRAAARAGLRLPLELTFEDFGEVEGQSGSAGHPSERK